MSIAQTLNQASFMNRDRLVSRRSGLPRDKLFAMQHKAQQGSHEERLMRDPELKKPLSLKFREGL
jgi:hypothetical protein